MPDIGAIREMVPAVGQTAYLNTGTCGPLPRVAYQAMLDEHAKELTPTRIDADHFPAMARARDEVRRAVAAAINAAPDDIAVTHRTTEGMFITILGYRWLPGDELLTTNIEHPEALQACYLAKRRYGVQVKMVNVGLGGGDPAEIVRAFEERITPRTRMIMLSHVSFSTGARLPLKEITALAHAHGVLVTVDAAQSFGALPVDVRDLGVDFYSCPGQKWMCGPEGSGSLYVSSESIAALEQVAGGGMRWDAIDFLGGHYVPSHGASRFDSSGQSITQTAGQRAATEWVTQTVGMEFVSDRVRQLAGQAYEALDGLPGVTVVTPREALAGLIAFTVEGITPPLLTERLAKEHNVTIRFVPRLIDNPDVARISVGFYNDQSDIERFIDGLQAVQASL
jgi:L-cysteine/cystine lyase